MFVRFLLGLGESGNFPAAIKTVAEWFPRRERAFATGLFNAGTNIGAVITPMAVPFITARFGWYWAFVLTGLLGFAWLVAVVDAVRPAGPASARRRARSSRYIRSDPPESTVRMPWAKPDRLPADVGVRGREVHDRSDLVAVPVLDARFLQPHLRAVAAASSVRR